jgi:hypothetical protein
MLWQIARKYLNPVKAKPLDKEVLTAEFDDL